MKVIKTLEELKELAKKYNREEFIKFMTEGYFYQNSIIYWECPSSYKNKFGKSELEDLFCEDELKCKECWRNATKDFVFKDDLEKEVSEGMEKIKQSKQQNKIVTYEEIDTSMNCGYALNYTKKHLDKRFKSDDAGLLYLKAEKIKYSDIPNLLSWLQDVYTYGQQILAEPEVEYVDFQTALAWMKEGNKTQLGVYTYYYEYENGQLYFTNGTLNNVAYLNLKEIESKEWVLIKEDK